jgi:hypothetical protein
MVLMSPSVHATFHFNSTNLFRNKMPVLTTGIFLLCTSLKYYYKATVASHTCTSGKSAEQANNDLSAVRNGAFAKAASV